MGVNGDRPIWLIFWLIFLARPLYHFCTVHIHLLTVLFYTSRPSKLTLPDPPFSKFSGRPIFTTISLDSSLPTPTEPSTFLLNDRQLRFIIVHFNSSDRSLYSLLTVYFGGDSIGLAQGYHERKNWWREKISHFYQFFVPTLVMLWLIVFSFSDFHKHVQACVQEGVSLMIIQFC